MQLQYTLSRDLYKEVQMSGLPRIVTLKFSYSNEAKAPKSVPWKPMETRVDEQKRKARSTGSVIIAPVENVTIWGFLLEILGQYTLVDAYNQERQKHQANKMPGATFFTSVFTFACNEDVKPSSAFFQNIKEKATDDLYLMCSGALWRVRAFDNPLYKDDVEVEGQRALNVNLEVRTPLWGPDGNKILVWQRDETGEKLLNLPKIPIKPNGALRMKRDGSVVVEDTTTA